MRDLRDPQKLGQVLLLQTASIRCRRARLADDLPHRLPSVVLEAADGIAGVTIADFDDHQAGPMCGLPPRDVEAAPATFTFTCPQGCTVADGAACEHGWRFQVLR